jgi:predicted nuclease of predicted toxin-antitoxin system
MSTRRWPRYFARDYDAVHVNEKGRSGLTDRDQLAFAAAEHRVIVTHNRRDFLALAAEWWTRGAPHAGIIYARQAPSGELLRRLLALLNTLTAEDLTDVVVPLEAFG